ncbi:MAG: preprotein translocase subunit SecA [Clostridiales bacterium]|jgi:preprotein translocase subunit SecA|nr:preprotein translocase subunit SecA [Clostridiales bacterium]
MGLLDKIFGSYSDKELKRIRPVVDKINALEADMESLSDEDLREKTDEFKARLADGETLDQLLPETFAVVREAGKRALGMRHFDVQLIGGIVLHQGRIAEMKTGEGKTLVATLPAYLNALTGHGVHIVTVNDYLAKRDAEWMGKIHRFLGLTVGVILHDLTPDERRDAYSCDITYATNNELGFDYLRDNMVVYERDAVQRDLNYGIIDEVDSILIDEARTPLIISGSSGKSTNLYKVADQFVRQLRKGRLLNEDEALNPLMHVELEEEGDFVVDEKQKTTSLTQDGVRKAERFFAVDNLSDPENLEIQHHINNALKANYNMHLDQDYVVQDGDKGEQEVVIVDEFTGRLMPGRRYSDGLHQAIEAKEGVYVNRESKTLATITFQNFFNRYAKKAGMTGTALTEEGEFREIYKMDVMVIPTNRQMIRADMQDQVYTTEQGKFRAVVRDIVRCHEAGQPVLVGTVTIDKSETLHRMLAREGIRHSVLNAKFHKQEAEIIAEAGKIGAVTIATNMAGRGTDIMLGGSRKDDETEREAEKRREDYIKVKELGGLRIIGTERHESRRIDNQLRGRAGRQGDPGSSQFYLSLEDDLLRLFGSDRMKSLVERLGAGEDDPIEAGMLTKGIENAQKKVEGNNFGIRKHLLDYDRVMNEHREIIYGERKRVLRGENLRDSIMNMIRDVVAKNVDTYCPKDEENPEEWDFAGLYEKLNPILHCRFFNVSDLDPSADDPREAFVGIILAEASELYEKRESEIGYRRDDDADPIRIRQPELLMRELERIIMLRVVDTHWMNHIDDMDQMRQGITLRAYAQRDPLVEYINVAYDMFEELSDNIKQEVVRGMFNIRLTTPPERREQVARPVNTSNETGSVKGPAKRSEKKVLPNDPCPCGSGKKYKYCHGIK